MLWGWSTWIQHNYTKRGVQGEHRHLGAQSSGYIWAQARWMPWKPQKTSGTSLNQRHERSSMSQEQVATIFWIGDWNWAFLPPYSSSSFPNALEKRSKSHCKKGETIQETPWSVTPASVIATHPFGSAHRALGQLGGNKGMMKHQNEGKRQRFHQSFWMTDEKGKKVMRVTIFDSTRVKAINNFF